MLEIIPLPVLTDNYIYLLNEPVSNETAVVDPALAQPVLDILDKKNWKLTYILNTHHHWDHVGGNLELKQKTGCKIIAAESDRDRIPGIDIGLKEDDVMVIGKQSAQIISTPGHTSGHIVYYFAEDNSLFCGDTLFVMGCGRLFEGTAGQMWNSLQKLKALPPSTRLYCTHEYTLANGRFALSVEPYNLALQKRMIDVRQLRAENKPTVPSTIEQERATNPFFRADSLTIQKNLNMQSQPHVQVFAELRKRKDSF
ncbi:Hydroxyacylglutathione hydrolase [Candidatus Methylobacter favarea]|uniref:Hydroxyacylglutathione hydrolase n=1 Tax=Candidatus Methylobacter favarea TaxID=2707345 RepID=A0A8S0WXP8_9GAMM|nr:hydroxyacylglutathione hydrolase [Candidatus Methylobacter favarea]CAA9889253.1 Hydroxyacylglutathione hydrolase [Candidatus Methylobacter favarea]